MSAREDFFEDLAATVDSWIDAAVNATTEQSTDLVWTEDPEAFFRVREALRVANVPRHDIRRVFEECLRGLTASTLSIVDGATVLAEKTRLKIIDDSGQSLGEALHDDFVLYWLNTRGEDAR